jgi:hypothetical protein
VLCVSGRRVLDILRGEVSSRVCVAVGVGVLTGCRCRCRSAESQHQLQLLRVELQKQKELVEIFKQRQAEGEQRLQQMSYARTSAG